MTLEGVPYSRFVFRYRDRANRRRQCTLWAPAPRYAYESFDRLVSAGALEVKAGSDVKVTSC